MKKTLFVLMVGLIIVFSCGDETVITDPVDLIALDDTPYEFSYGAFPAPDLPLDNLLTQQGVQLGKMLFYEKKLR